MGIVIVNEFLEFGLMVFVKKREITVVNWNAQLVVIDFTSHPYTLLTSG